MAEPLGLSPAEERAYFTALRTSHDFTIEVDVYRARDMKRVDTLGPGEFLDGQANIQRDTAVRRTATLGFAASVIGGIYPDRVLGVKHIIAVPGVGEVVSHPFFGPVTKVTDGDGGIAVECQDFTAFFVEGGPSITVRKGMNAVDAIRYLLSRRGCRRFRFPTGTRRRLTRTYSTGWTTETSPWAVATAIARSLGYSLDFSCDGFATLRSRIPVVATLSTGPGGMVTELPDDETDFTQVRNCVRVVPGKGKPLLVQPPKANPLRPSKLSLNGAPRYLPDVLEDDALKTYKAALRAGKKRLGEVLGVQTTSSISCVPIFHLDVRDVIRVETPTKTYQLPFYEGSIPLGTGGDMTIGRQSISSRPARAWR